MSMFSQTTGQPINRTPVSLKAPSAETVSTDQSPQDFGALAVLNLEVTVTAVSGSSPTLLLTVKGSNDGITYITILRIGSDGFALGNASAPASISTTGTYRGNCTAMRFMYASSTIGGTGTPTFTYSVGGTGV